MTDNNDIYSEKRRQMVNDQLISRGISDSNIIEAMLVVPRHRFVAQNLINHSYKDCPLPIGMGQTISQPYIVAYMTELLNLKKGDKVLEIGTGSGYQAAILAELGCEVYSIEIVEDLASRAQDILQNLGYKNIHFKKGDGYMGWKEHSPYDAIIVTAAPPEIPEPLTQQIKEGGKMVIPVGDYFQELILLKKTRDGLKEKKVTPVSFVPMTGEAQKLTK